MSALTLPEANALASALLFSACGNLGVRALLIKGPALERYGLRGGHISADVDALIAPWDAADLRPYLQTVGWQPRPLTDGQRRMSRYSLTLSNPNWPNDLDLHLEYPGLLVGAEAAFEVLWRHREKLTLAGLPCWTTDKASAVVILALHSLRSNPRFARHTQELQHLVTKVLPKMTPQDRDDLARRIVDLGADDPLRALPEFSVLLDHRRSNVDPRAQAYWRSKLAQAQGPSPWAQFLREARPRDRPRLALGAIWPSAHDLRLMDEDLVDTGLGRARSRARRAKQFVWRALRRLRQR